MRRLADAFVVTWQKQGQWGRMHENRTGAVAEFNTSGGVMAVGDLRLAAHYYTNDAYLKTASRLPTSITPATSSRLGQTTGGCADILHNADAETAASFMTALLTLYETTSDRQWLERSRQLAHLVATWTTSYDYQLPADTELARLGAKLAGVYWASTQNKHGAPGICTSSGDALFRIYRATGKRQYAELLHDIVHAHGDSIRPGGFTNERLTYCDAERRGNRGNVATGWNELNGFLMALEIPGIYLRTDTAELFVFDHVEARVVKRDTSGVALELRNPTKLDASVTLLAESGSQADKPLTRTAFLHWSKLDVKAGEAGTVTLR